MTGAEPAADEAADAEAISARARAVAYLLAHGQATRAKLRELMGLGWWQTPMQHFRTGDLLIDKPGIYRLALNYRHGEPGRPRRIDPKPKTAAPAKPARKPKRIRKDKHMKRGFKRQILQAIVKSPGITERGIAEATGIDDDGVRVWVRTLVWLHQVDEYPQRLHPGHPPLLVATASGKREAGLGEGEIDFDGEVSGETSIEAEAA